MRGLCIFVNMNEQIEIKNVLICGIGAIGSIFANKFSEADVPLKILVDKRRLEQYSQNPPVINGKKLDLDYVLPENRDYKADFDGRGVLTNAHGEENHAFPNRQQSKTADLIIIATKYSGLHEAVKNIENFVGENTIIISLLNGISSEEIIAEKYGWEKVLCSNFLGHSSVRTGNEVKAGTLNLVVFGSTEPNDERVARLKNFFVKVGIDYKIAEDIKRAMWLKFALNVSCNQLSAITCQNFGQMLSNPKMLSLIENIIKEVAAVAKATGVNNTETILDECLADLKLMSPDGKTSMLQDIEAGRKTEVEMFAGTMVCLGKQHTIPTPYNQVMLELIEAMEVFD